LGNTRTQAFDAYFVYSPSGGDNLLIYARGGSEGNAAQFTVDTSADQPVHDIILAAQPTAVRLSSFTARRSDNGQTVVVEWQTSSETDIVGFNVHRAEQPQGPFTRLNGDLIFAQNPGGIMGADYAVEDTTALADRTYYYKLEVVTFTGESDWSEIAGVTPVGCSGLSAPQLVSPWPRAEVPTRKVTLVWSATSCANRYFVIVRQGGPKGRVVERGKRLTTTSYTTRALARGQAYVWRVKACGDNGCKKSPRQQFTIAAEDSGASPGPESFWGWAGDLWQRLGGSVN
jgi:hypothetical protein